jgi:hypothetical protein
MKNFGIFLIMISLSFLEMSAQNFSIGFQSGMGFFRMEQIKNLNSELLSSLPFKADLTSNTPPYLYFQPYIGFNPIQKIEAGFFITLHSTGSRISLQDYSGQYLFDIFLKCYNPGLYLDVKIVEQNCFSVCLYSEAGLVLSKMEISESLKIGIEEETEFQKFKSGDYFIKPGIKLKYSLKRCSFSCNLAYFGELFKQKLYSIEDKNTFLYDKEGNPVSANWSGIRMGLSWSININNIKKNVDVN